jgi:FkbM family methyltransferase
MSQSLRDSLFLKLRRFGPLRKLYRAVAGNEGRERRSKLAAFYSQFIRPNDLVFDIGANIGVYSEVFQSIGARVISVEPNPECAEQITRTTSRDRVTIVNAAAGDKTGTCKLFVNEVDVLSSVSPAWVEREKGGAWITEIEVPMVTIDDLVARYGMPRFIKLDVEGFELPALSGMTRQPEYLSFEFHRETLDKGEACFDGLSPLTRFDYAIIEPFRFEIGHWVSREEILKRLRAANASIFGDVIAWLDDIHSNTDQ